MSIPAPTRRALLASALATPLAGAFVRPANARRVPAASPVTFPAAGAPQKAVLAGGCFWGIQGVYSHVKGVSKAVSGYAGGTLARPTYELVGTGRTGHAESVEITFDPAIVTYNDILQIFFSVCTDPTQLNRQEPDEGPQYRNEIFYVTPEQKRLAETYVAQLKSGRVYARPIVTKVSALKAFWRAEDYHQDYLLLHPTADYIAMYDIPKVADLRESFPALWRPQAITTPKA